MGETLTARLVGGTGGTITKVVDIAMPVGGWHGGTGKWSQIVEVAVASSFSKIDLQPSADQLSTLQKLEAAMMVENADGVVTVYVTGNKPKTDITMQATVTEVIRETPGSKICGNTVGWTAPLLYPKSV
jgi:hypothetical protein